MICSTIHYYASHCICALQRHGYAPIIGCTVRLLHVLCCLWLPSDLSTFPSSWDPSIFFVAVVALDHMLLCLESAASHNVIIYTHIFDALD